MKKIYFLILMVLLSLMGWGQSAMPATFDFTAGANFALYDYSGTVFPGNITIGSGSSTGSGNFVTDLGTDAANGTTAGTWQGESFSGISYLGNSSRRRGSFLFRGNTTGRIAVNVRWTCRTILDQANNNYIELQWRNGTSGNWNNVTGVTTSGVYPYMGGSGSHTYEVFLPAGAENNPDLQIRWIYYEDATGGARDRIAIDDIIISSYLPTSATDRFRSATSGNWTSTSSWESSADAVNWIPATLTPTPDATAITIRNGHNITISSNGLSVAKTFIQAGGQLSVGPGITFTIADEAGTDLDVGGTFLNAGGAHTWTGTWGLADGGTYIHNTSSSADAVYNALGYISQNSTWIYRGSSSLAVNSAFANKTYGHLRLESTSGSLDISPAMNDYDTCYINDFFIGENVTLNGGSELSAFKVAGNFTNQGEIFSLFSSFNVVFTGIGKAISTSPATEFAPSRVVFAAGSSYTLNTGLSPLSGNNPNDPNSPDRLIVEENAVLNATNFQVSGYGTVRINGTLRTARPTSVFGTNLYRISFGPASVMHYNGNVDQVFLSRSDYANVEISGGSNKSLNGSATLSGTLILTSGKVILGANNLTVDMTVTGGSASSYIVTDGTGALTINNIGATAKTFPVGPGTSLYHPVTIANTGTVDNFSVKVSSTDLPCVLAPKGVTATWDISEATAGGSDCAITLDYQGAATGTSYSALSAKILHCNGTTMDYSNGSVTGTVASGTGFTSFSPFGVAVDDAGGALPAIFANVKAAEQGGDVLVSWSNLTETDVIDYTIEYSANGNSFVAIGAVNARSNNDGREDYSFLHNNVTSAINYYRIRSTEFNNESKYSIVVKVDRRKGQTIVSVYPNPSSGNDIVMQATDLAKGRYTMTVYAANGQQVSVQSLNHNGGSVTEPVLIPATLKAGIYTLLLQSAETKITSRFVVR